MKQGAASRTSNGQRGFSLIEIMVSLLLGILLMAGVVQIFAGTKLSYNIQDGLGRVQENGRFAIEQIRRDVRMAGYLGCSNVADLLGFGGLIINHLNGGTAFAYDLAIPVQGFEASGTGSTSTYTIASTNPSPSGVAANWSPALDADLVATPRVLPGSDVLVVRYVNAGVVPVTAANTASSVPVQAGHGFASGEIVVVTDCSKASIYQASISGNNVQVDTAGSAIPGNSGILSLPGEQYGSDAIAGALQTIVLYVGRNPAGEPALYRRRLDASGSLVSEELVDGIETLQVLYGVDTNGDGSVNSYLTANNVAAWENVVSVRASVLVRSVEPASTETDSTTYAMLGDPTSLGLTINPADDRRIRKTFTATVSLRNLLR